MNHLGVLDVAHRESCSPFRKISILCFLISMQWLSINCVKYIHKLLLKSCSLLAQFETEILDHSYKNNDAHDRSCTSSNPDFTVYQ